MLWIFWSFYFDQVAAECLWRSSSNLVGLCQIFESQKASYQLGVRLIIHFFNMGQPRHLLFIFLYKAFYNNDSQTGHSVDTFQHLWQVAFAFWSYLSSREIILGRCHPSLLALQDGEITIITQSIEDMMLLAKLHRVIRVVRFTMLKLIKENRVTILHFLSQKYQRDN